MSAVHKQLIKSAKEALASQNYAWAKEQAAAVVAGDPSSFHAHLFLGLASQHLGEQAAALAAFQQARRLAPRNPHALQVGWIAEICVCVCVSVRPSC